MTFKTLQTRLTIACSRNLESLPSTYAHCNEQARVELVNISFSHGVSGVFPAVTPCLPGVSLSSTQSVC